jgi:hypothetical protein
MAPDEIDLAGEPVPHFLREPYNPVRKQESVRAWVTGALVAALIILIGFAGVAASLGSKEHWDETKEMLNPAARSDWTARLRIGLLLWSAIEERSVTTS